MFKHDPSENPFDEIAACMVEPREDEVEEISLSDF
jgi:hypothetical protein